MRQRGFSLASTLTTPFTGRGLIHSSKILFHQLAVAFDLEKITEKRNKGERWALEGLDMTFTMIA